MAVISSAPLATSASACTGLSIQSKDGGIVAGRRLEFGADPQSSLSGFPTGTEFSGTAPKGTGLKFKAKYGFESANGFGVKDTIIDGFNEKGLYVGIFYFPGYADCMEATPENNAMIQKNQLVLPRPECK